MSKRRRDAQAVIRKSDAVSLLDLFWHFSLVFWSLFSAFRFNKPRVRCSCSVGGELRKLKSYSSIMWLREHTTLESTKVRTIASALCFSVFLMALWRIFFFPNTTKEYLLNSVLKNCMKHLRIRQHGYCVNSAPQWSNISFLNLLIIIHWVATKMAILFLVTVVVW